MMDPQERRQAAWILFWAVVAALACIAWGVFVWAMRTAAASQPCNQATFEHMKRLYRAEFKERFPYGPRLLRDACEWGATSADRLHAMREIVQDARANPQ